MLPEVENIQTEVACLISYWLSFSSLSELNLQFTQRILTIANETFMHNLPHPFSYFSLLYLLISSY